MRATPPDVGDLLLRSVALERGQPSSVVVGADADADEENVTLTFSGDGAVAGAGAVVSP